MNVSSQVGSKMGQKWTKIRFCDRKRLRNRKKLIFSQNKHFQPGFEIPCRRTRHRDSLLILNNGTLTSEKSHCWNHFNDSFCYEYQTHESISWLCAVELVADETPLYQEFAGGFLKISCFGQKSTFRSKKGHFQSFLGRKGHFQVVFRSFLAIFGNFQPIS